MRSLLSDRARDPLQRLGVDLAMTTWWDGVHRNETAANLRAEVNRLIGTSDDERNRRYGTEWRTIFDMLMDQLMLAQARNLE